MDGQMLKIGKFSSAIVLCSVMSLFLSACGSDYPLGKDGAEDSGGFTGILSGSGSSAQKPALDVWRSGFSKRHSQVRVQYSPDGSGAGRNALLSGAVQFAGSDAYLKDSELEAADRQCGSGGALNIPVYISPIVVFFNLPGIGELNLGPVTIARIFRGEIAYWDDPSIKGENRGIELPHVAVDPIHRNDSSGTTQNFTDYLAATAPRVWTDASAQSWPAGVSGESAKGTSGVVTTASMNEGSISYADNAEVPQWLGRVKLRVGNEFVAASRHAAGKAIAASSPLTGRRPHDVVVNLDRTTVEPGAYPLVFISYHIVCSGYPDQKTVDLVKNFEGYVVSDQGQKDAAEIAYSVPLTESLAQRAQAAIDSIEVLP